MMVHYIYDGSFDGLLTCVYHHYYDEAAAGITTADRYQPDFFTNSVDVKTDEEKASKVYNAIEKKISPYDLRRVYKAYLTEDEEKEIKILRYIVLGFKLGSKISMLHGDETVFAIQALEKKIHNEKERMLQFIRFSVMEGDVLYAKIEPDNDVLELCAKHFTERYRNDPFIIHDVRRDKALVAFKGQWYVTDFTEENKPKLAEDELEYRKLWKEYFESIAIKERKNRRCQENHMPRRYHKHLTEVTTI